MPFNVRQRGPMANQDTVLSVPRDLPKLANPDSCCAPPCWDIHCENVWWSMGYIGACSARTVPRTGIRCLLARSSLELPCKVIVASFDFRSMMAENDRRLRPGRANEDQNPTTAEAEFGRRARTVRVAFVTFDHEIGREQLPHA